MNDENQDFNEKARLLLDEGIDSIDSATLSRLHRARNRALKSQKKINPWLKWSGGGAIAATVLFAMNISLESVEPLPSIYEDPIQQAAAEEIELLNDLEFVAWLLLEEVEDGEFNGKVSSS
jgi:predicted PP-loop superfamily ATPase